MANNNVQNVKFLRNGNLFANRDEALTRLNGQTLTVEQDGTIILARYGSGNDVKTLAGYVYYSGADSKSITIFDTEGASGDVETLREEINAKLGEGVGSGETETVSAQLAALSGNAQSTSAETSVAGAKKYTDDKIAETIDGLDVAAITAPAGAFIKSVSQADGKVSATTEYMPTVAAISAEGQAITAVSQANGTVSATTGDIAAAHVTVADSGELFTATTVEGALAEIAAEIDAMDKDADVVAGQVVTTVSETDGKVSETKANVKDLQLGGYSKDSSATGDITSTDTINAALSKLENKAAAITIDNDDHSINVTTAASGTNIAVNIKSGEKVLAKDGDAGVYTDIKLSGITPSSTTVKEEFALIGTDGTQLGTSIKVYKDSSVVSITYITDPADAHYQNLKYTYIDVSGNTQTEYVDISSLVLEAEFASGITVTNHVAHGVVDSTSETNSGGTAFLTVGADGFKVSGIKQEIIDRINELDATCGTQTIATDKHVAVEVIEADGKITTVTVVEDNIADADDLAALSAKTFTVATSSNASITTAVTNAADGTKSVDLITDASKIKMTGFTSTDVLSGIAESSSVTEAFEEVDKVITDNEEVVSSALNDLNERIDELSGGTASGLTEEIAARKAVDGQSGQTYAANSGKAYISGATSLNDADIKLNDALKTLSDATVNEVQVNGVALTETSNAVNVQISAVAGTGASTTPLEVKTDNSTGAVTIQLNVIDCGTY